MAPLHGHQGEGSQRRGTVFPVSKGSQVFNRQFLHTTMPWTGRQDVDVAFTPGRRDKLTRADVNYLTALGFKLSDQSSVSAQGAAGDHQYPEQSLNGQVISQSSRVKLMPREGPNTLHTLTCWSPQP